MKSSKSTGPKKEIACSGEPCAAHGSEFKIVKGQCSEGVASSVVKSLTAKAGERAHSKASTKCKGTGCSCVGRFYVTKLGKSPKSDDCVWWVVGAWRGVCAADCDGVSEGPSDDLIGTIDAHGEMEDGPVPERPEGRCDGRPCAASASAAIELDAAPPDGIDSALFLALLDAAARAAEERAARLCPKGCECKGEFVVIDSGVEAMNLGRPKWVWWVGGEWRGKCLKLV